jgi:hypothetical protein
MQSFLLAETQAFGLEFIINRLLQPQVLVFMIPITGIICGCTVAAIKAIIRHRERIAMIEQGMRPDDRKDRRQEGPDNLR